MIYPRELYSIDESRTRRNLAEYDRKRARIYDTYYSRYTADERKQHDLRTRHSIIKEIEKELEA